MDLSELAIELFCQFDPEQKGYITQDQLLNGSTQDSPFSDVQIHSIFALLDKDKKGIITLSDFTDAFLDLSDVKKVDESSNESDDDNDNYRTNNNENETNEYDYEFNQHENIYRNGNEEIYNGSDIEDEYENDEEILNYLNGLNEEESISPSKMKKFKSIDSLFVNDFCRTSSTNDCRHDEFVNTDQDDYWWEHGKRIDGINQLNTKRKKSLPSLTSTLPNGKLYTNLLKSKKWKSYDHGMNRANCFDTKKLNFKLDSTRNSTHSLDNSNHILDALDSHEHRNEKSHHDTNGFKPFTNPSNLYNTIKNHNLNQNQNIRNNVTPPKCELKSNRISQEFDEIFGASHSVTKNLERCNSCTLLNSETLDDNLKVQKITLKPNLRRFMSHSSANLAVDTSKTRSHRLLRAQSSLEINEGKDTFSEALPFLSFNMPLQKKSWQHSKENLKKKNGFYISMENLSSSHDYLPEEWESYLRRIGGVSLYAGNQTLRYLWQQIGSYQKDLMLPLEDFLKGIIEEHESVYSRCQEVESTLHTKVEQHERDIDSLYEEFDKTLQREVLDLEKKHCEREDVLKTEFHRIIDMKDQTYQDNISHIAEITDKLEESEQEICSLQVSKHKAEEQCFHLLQEQQNQHDEMEHIVEDNVNLKEKNKTDEENIRDLQECINQLLKNAEDEKEKNMCFMRQFKDLLEEKEFLEANISNLSMENIDLRNINKSLLQKDDELDESLKFTTDNDTEHSIYMKQSSPITPIRKSFHGLPSLHDEINTPYQSIHIEDTEEFTDPLSPILKQPDGFQDDSIEEESITQLIVLDKSTDSIDQTLEQSDEMNSQDNLAEVLDIYTSTPTKAFGLRFANAVQTEFKLILCGDCNVGKTSLIHRLCFNKFSKLRKTTTKIDSYSKIIETSGNKIKLNIWDTVGQERFNSLPRSYYRKSDVVILVYDISEESSFVNAKSWLRAIHDYTKEDALLVLVANKLDLNHKRCVPREKGETLAEESDAIFIEVSVKTGENIEKLVDMISRAPNLLRKSKKDISLVGIGVTYGVTSISTNRMAFVANFSPC